MNSVETTGRTVEEALEKALSALGIRKENSVVEVISEPAQGLLSFIGPRTAHIKVKPRYEPAGYLKVYLQGIVDSAGLKANISVREEEDGLYASINGEKVGVLIGRRGKTLNELQDPVERGPTPPV